MMLRCCRVCGVILWYITFFIIDGLHMHQTGARMWDTHWAANASDPKGTLVGAVNSVYFYQFSMQQITYHSPPYIIKRGDRLSVNCVYDTTGRRNPTEFGPSSDDEMCLHFLFYYPLLFSPMRNQNPYSVCGSIQLANRTMSTLCGDLNISSWLPSVANPVYPDPLIYAKSSFGHTPQQCSAKDTEGDGEVIGDPTAGLKLGWVAWMFVIIGVIAVLAVVIFLLVKRNWVVEYIGIRSSGAPVSDSEKGYGNHNNNNSNSNTTQLMQGDTNNMPRYGATATRY
eukprot:TRINITY_DN1793_c0_g1_i2.p2 TRINITY_DN1793_c0_g1~~TRINITY_DN1793_c0_g1_i2.p2  ORF type:complete len:283 (-),score=36.81 TRINITY_DN1793_c0_g1_i2:62-910(-)